MMSSDEELDVIMQYESKEIIRALLTAMDGYHGLPFITCTRRVLTTFWHDQLGESAEVQVFDALFIFKGKEERHHSGGSWTPECDYTEVIFTCRVCGATVDQGDRRLHFRNCEKVSEVRKKSASLENFIKNLKNAEEK